MIDGGCLILAPKYNSQGKKDATGAFLPEAERFRRFHGLPKESLVTFDNSAPLRDRRREIVGIIQRHGKFSVLAHFGHGTTQSIQAGFTISTLGPLAAALVAVGCKHVVLYSCLTGASRSDPSGDGGLADTLRDTVAAMGGGCTVYAHTTAAHTTRNPFVRIFATQAGKGGQWTKVRGSPGWLGWVRALRGDLRFDFMAWTRELSA